MPRRVLWTAMVALAGEPKGLLLDPCCGSGTILGEAIEVGWDAQGVDIDPEAVRTAKDNVRGATVEEGDSAGPFRMIVQPLANAATTLRSAWLKGKFHGVKAMQTPTGSRSTVCCTRGSRAGMSRP